MNKIDKCLILKIESSNRSISMTRRISTNEIASKSVYGRCELDSHADTTVAGSNCIILQYTGKECSVQPYIDVYDPLYHVSIVHADTAYRFQDTG